ncbi:MAG: DUF1631 domain-containing protein [Proteobacteria bacterium]|nr:DUF1631 domain-containing protein [Pseudomonadota bacterium]
MNATSSAAQARRPIPGEFARILSDCRDLAVHRLLLTFTSLQDRVGDMLLERAGKSYVREEQQLFLEARQTLKVERPALMAAFEKLLRAGIEARVASEPGSRTDFSQLEADELSLVDLTTLNQSVVVGNIVRSVENLCHDELVTLNRGIGHLLARPELESHDNPLGPATVIDAYARAIDGLEVQSQVKFQILKELNLAPLAEIGAIYADVNRHLASLHIVPARSGRRRADRTPPQRRQGKAPEAPPPSEMDIMAMFREIAAHAGPAFARHPAPPSPASMVLPPMPPTPSGYIPGPPILASSALHEGLTRLQAGQTGFDIEGQAITFAGIPIGTHNVLRDLQESPLGQRANQLEAMTIEMVAMLFDFVFETRDLPDGIKALLARLQIPVLKVAMLDGAFFAKKSHPARLLVNALAAAGLGWAPEMGQDDPLYRIIDRIVHRIIDGFAEDLAIFDQLRGELEAFLSAEEQAAEATFAPSTDAINESDRRDLAAAVARAEVERRIESYPIPQFLAEFLRRHWQQALENAYLREGQDSDAWSSSVATLEDLVWSIQPKKASEDRRHLVALLPSLLKRMSANVPAEQWEPGERDTFMSHLVEAHAAAVKPSFASAPSPTAAMADAARADAEAAKASGDADAAARAEALAAAMAPAAPVEEPLSVLDDEYLEIASSLERGQWVEFESEEGQLSFAKLAWVSPLRGTYLFTNRQGQKALSMTAEELAGQFRDNRARLVEAEPLIDRAFTSVISELSGRYELATAAG